VRIALVSEHASPLAAPGGVDAGGQNVHVRELALALGRLGHRVTVYTRRDDVGSPAREAFGTGVDVERIVAGPRGPIPKDDIVAYVPQLASELTRAWRRDPPDVAHAHFWMSAVATMAAARPLGVPTVATFHALGEEKREQQGSADTSPANRIVEERRIARGVDRIVATSSAEAFRLTRMGAPVGRVAIVPCGVDLARFTPHGPRETRAPGGAPFRIVSLGRLVERKGTDDLLRALVGVAGAELVVAGGAPGGIANDPDARRLEALARELGVRDRIDLRGSVGREAVPALLRSADVVVCTPWYEPFGMVALEAMACGVPVVTSTVGGLVDTVVDGITGAHVPPRDAERLGAVLRALRDDPAARRRLGRAGAERARARYDWSRIAAESVDVYCAIVQLELPIGRTS